MQKGDLKRSEEYYERAILADPHDGEVLSQYAKLQWDVHKDQDRAEMYYDQAVQAAPDDWLVNTCFYLFYFFNGFVSLNQLLSFQCICNPYEV